jgi:hypothetical protein
MHQGRQAGSGPGVKLARVEEANSRCQGQTRSGRPCRAAATAGGLCFFPACPNKASKLGRIGGKSNRHFAGANTNPLPTMDNVLDPQLVCYSPMTGISGVAKNSAANQVMTPRAACWNGRHQLAAPGVPRLLAR